MKQIISLGLAVCFSFFLFVAMQMLINNNAIAYVPKAIPVIDINMNIKDSQIEPIDRRKPPKIEPLEKQPEKPQEPKTTQPKKIVESFKVSMASGTVPGFRPSLNSIMKGDGFVGVDLLNGEQSSELSPKIRIEPFYPPKAQREGKEGFVTLNFDISPLGEPVNIAVVKSNPRGYFEQNAKRALRKWQYSPKRENGVAVTVYNQSVTLAFELEK